MDKFCANNNCGTNIKEKKELFNNDFSKFTTSVIKR